MRLIFLLLPWLELWTLIELGAATSAFTAILYVFITLVLGITIIRRQGEGMMLQLREQAQRGGLVNPDWWVDDIALVMVGLLLMIPGLITDFLALVFLVGPLRRSLGRLLGVRVVRNSYSGAQSGAHSSSRGPGGANEQVTLEGEYRRLDD